MDLEYDVYNYDKCQFFSLLESPRFRSRYSLVQEQQGLVVCPLELIRDQVDVATNQFDLIDRHLFIPSPFYKNTYVPLAALSSQSLPTTGYNATSPGITSLSSVGLHPFVHLVYTGEEFFLVKQGKTICKNVKLLDTQTAYTDSDKQYKILIVDKELFYSGKNLPRIGSVSSVGANMNQMSGELRRGNRSDAEDDLDDEEELAIRKSYKEIRRGSVIAYSINDVLTFRQCVDFMNNTSFFVDESDLVSTGRELVSNERRRKRLVNVGEKLLVEMDLFKKTYIILPTHMKDCAKQLSRVYEKYIERFMRSHTHDNKKLVNVIGDAELLVSVACEIIVIGCIYSKLWPCILSVNEKNDAVFLARTRHLKQRLEVDDSDRIDVWSEHLHLDRAYFRINFKPVLKEMNKLSMLNNAFESLMCIKTCIDLLTTELTISLLKQKSTSSPPPRQSTPLVVTSESLIPLLAFVIMRSSLECFKSIVYFVDTFCLSLQPSHSTNVSNSILVSELSFFMTSFKAAIQLIESLNC